MQKIDYGATVIFEKINGNTVIENLVRPPIKVLILNGLRLILHRVHGIFALSKYFQVQLFIPRYHLKDVIVGKIYFLLVRIKIRHMELAIIKREIAGTGKLCLPIMIGNQCM